MKRQIIGLLVILLATSVWAAPPTPPFSLPSQTTATGKYLKSSGTVGGESWDSPAGAGNETQINRLIDADHADGNATTSGTRSDQSVTPLGLATFKSQFTAEQILYGDMSQDAGLSWDGNEFVVNGGFFIGGKARLSSNTNYFINSNNSANSSGFRWYHFSTDAANYQYGYVSNTATSVVLGADSNGTGADNIGITITPKGTGILQVNADGNFTGSVTAPTFVGALTGNADTATTSTNVIVADTADTTTWPVLATDAAATVAPKTDGALTYNAGTGLLSSTGVTASGVGTFGTVSAGSGAFTVDADGDVVAKSMGITRGDWAQYISLYEATSDGNSTLKIQPPAKLTGLGANATITFDETLAFTGPFTDGKYCTYASSGAVISCDATPAGDGDFKADGSVVATGNFVFEGSATDGNETTFAITNPTADRTITFPDASGTVAFTVSPSFTTPNIGAATGTSIALGADPAEAGAVMLANGAAIGWEDATEATITHVDNTGLKFNLPIILANDESISNADDTEIAFNGTESIALDLNTGTANEVQWKNMTTGSTSVDKMSFSALNLATTGWIQGGIKIDSDANGEDNTTMAAAGLYGTLFIATGAGTWTLPTAVAGMSMCLLSSGAAAELILDIQPTDNMRLNGTEDADAGHGITNATAEAAGDFVCVVAVAANKWSTMGIKGTWTAQ